MIAGGLRIPTESLRVVWRVHDKEVGGILRCKPDMSASSLHLHRTTNMEARPTARMMEGVDLGLIWSTNEQVRKMYIRK